MKRQVIVVICLILSVISYAQGWQKVDQSDFNMKYKLPSDWNIDGFGGENWDDYGSSVCKCSGTINFSGYDSTKVGMVVYPCLKEDVNTEKRQKVWSYVFIKEGPIDTIKTENLTFYRQKSDFDNGDDYYNPQISEAWQLIAYYGKYAFVIYFWGLNESMKKEEKTIMKILESFEAVKK